MGRGGLVRLEGAIFVEHGVKVFDRSRVVEVDTVGSMIIFPAGLIWIVFSVIASIDNILKDLTET